MMNLPKKITIRKTIHTCEIMSKKNSLGTLWKYQYEPREIFIKKNLDSDNLKKWNEQTFSKKITTIDRLEAKGFFKKYGLK